MFLFRTLEVCGSEGQEFKSPMIIERAQFLCVVEYDIDLPMLL